MSVWTYSYSLMGDKPVLCAPTALCEVITEDEGVL